jgi:3-oxoacyl-(acyl-carrier-protein) synthase
MAANKAVYITGMGAICAIGSNAEEVRESLCSGQSGIEKTSLLQAPLKFETVTGEVALTNSELADYCGVDPQLPRTTLLAIKAAEEAIKDAGLDYSGLKTGLISGQQLAEWIKRRSYTTPGHQPLNTFPVIIVVIQQSI